MALTTEQNRDEIIASAKEAGFQEGWLNLWATNFERFAALVAAKEREAYAQVCEGMKSVPPKGGPEDVERGFNAGLARASRAIRSRLGGKP